MSRHSKNNNASSVFTYAERQKLNYGTQEMRIGRDSLRDFDACFLCLSKVRDPVCCTQGHMACKECMYNDILAQKRDILKHKRLNDDMEASKKEKIAEQVEQAEEKERQLFLRTQDSLLPSSVSMDKKEDTAKGRGVETSFWIPSKTPGMESHGAGEAKTQVMCPFGGDHPLNLKKLVHVKFSGEKKTFYCPSCRKTLTNSLQLCLPRGCGHVTCKLCSDKFVKQSGVCFVCDEKVKGKDIVSLHNEGTGFSSRSKVDIKKTNIAFKG